MFTIYEGKGTFFFLEEIVVFKLSWRVYFTLFFSVFIAANFQLKSANIAVFGVKKVFPKHVSANKSPIEFK
jgi:hypothetical protein